VLGLVQAEGFLSTMQHIGTAAVLFMAGMEIDLEQIRGRPLSLALRGWIASVGLAFLAVAVLDVIPGVRAPWMVTIALTTTGLGALLPILRDGGQLETPFGRQLLAAGTIGEVGPIVATALCLFRIGRIAWFGRRDHHHRIAGEEHEPGHRPGAGRGCLAVVVAVPDARRGPALQGTRDQSNDRGLDMKPRIAGCHWRLNRRARTARRQLARETRPTMNHWAIESLKN
jgi:hypothetical protein